MYDTSLSSAQLATVLDNAPVAIYVSAVHNWELLYANQRARDLILRELGHEGSTCYGAAGYDKPCPFCRAEKMSRSALFVREFEHPKNHQIYQLSGKIIDWEGKPAHIEYILDITDKKRKEKQTKALKKQLQTTFACIPCGLCVYKFDGESIAPLFHNPAFYEIMGYSEDHKQDIERNTSFLGVHPEDKGLLLEKIKKTIQGDGQLCHTYRLFNDHEEEYRWIHLEASVKSQPDGNKLLYAVYSDVSERIRMENQLAGVQLEMDHLINSIPGGIASYEEEEGRFISTFFSDGIAELSGHTRDEYMTIIQHDGFQLIYEQDKPRVLAAIQNALALGSVLDISFRVLHKDERLVWVHMNGRRMGPLTDNTRIYAVFTGMSAEARLFQNLANKTADGIYVIDRDNFDLLYTNELKNIFMKDGGRVGEKCYAALHGKNAPCDFCTLKTHAADGNEHQMVTDETDRYYSTRFWLTDWNGIPAYVKYVQDVTAEIQVRKEKERLEQYFQTLVKNLPGGVAVVHYEKGGRMTPEFLSDGFAAMTGMTLEEAWRLYREDAMTGVHPEDQKNVWDQMNAYIASGESHCEIIYRLKKGGNVKEKDGYIWVKNTLSLIQNEDGEHRVYAVYYDITKEREEQNLLRRQFKELLLQHYRTPDPNALVIGHCNITQNEILEIIDYTDSDLVKNFGTRREGFFIGVAGLIVDEKERSAFLNKYLNQASLDAYRRNETELIQKCFIKLPKEDRGRYIQFKVNLVETPDTGDITGILAVTDITAQTISDRILHKLSVSSYDVVVDLDLRRDRYTVLTSERTVGSTTNRRNHFSDQVSIAIKNLVVPKDKKLVAEMMAPELMMDRLTRQGTYSFSFSIAGDKGDILTKNVTVSDIDLRIGRVCIASTDITNSLREQQGMLNMIAYTFEMAGFINISSQQLTMYTRKTVLENLPPYVIEHYDHAMVGFTQRYGRQEDRAETLELFRLETMLQRLTEKPAGYDFVFRYRTNDENRYKQINVLWGDENHRTICLVRADVTDMLASERETKKTLERALELAKEANRTKSDFLSAMSHDIRTPMNAIMGMTSLAIAHLEDRNRVADCLRKISISSKHLLSLINDVLDMSKIERSKITLNRVKISIPELMDQFSAIMSPQARDMGIGFTLQVRDIAHESFYGDTLRINQILLNILSNAIKFTPEGGTVNFIMEEIPPIKNPDRARYRFTVSDTGVGISSEFKAQIFEPFARSRSSARIEGTGLGLSITKGLVDLMEGDITVESQVNEGAIFRVELEFETASEEAENSVDRPDTPIRSMVKEVLFAGRCFLVAEDNAINAEILCSLMEMYGAKSILKTDGAETVKAFQNAEPGTYDAILMDIQMPVMNGYEATRTIRGMDRPDAGSIPIIAMTANAFAEDVQKSAEAGMTAHVAKPIDVDVLETTLCKALKVEV